MASFQPLSSSTVCSDATVPAVPLQTPVRVSDANNGDNSASSYVCPYCNAVYSKLAQIRGHLQLCPDNTVKRKALGQLHPKYLFPD